MFPFLLGRLKKSTEPLALEKAIGVGTPNQCARTCCTPLHVCEPTTHPSTSDVSLLVPPLHLINMWNILLYVEHFYALSCGPFTSLS